MLRGLAESLHGAANLLEAHRLRRWVVAEGDIAGPERLPRAFRGCERLSARPRLVARSLATGVRDLDRGNGALLADEVRDRLPRFRMSLGPDAGIPWRDSPLRSDRARFHAQQHGASHPAAAEAHEKPFGGHRV